MTVLLSVHGLTKSYGPRPLFTDLSFDLRAGDRVGLIGPNGSGKSTLLRASGRLNFPGGKHGLPNIRSEKGSA
jgi:ATPase subunit of ABC transporter with duplicated ATPase domains